MLPVIIGHVNPNTKSIIYYYLVGILPKEVYANVVKFIKTNSTDGKVMHKYYGEHWRDYFIKFNPYESLKSMQSHKTNILFKDFIIGGAADDDENLPFDLDDKKSTTDAHTSRETISNICVTDFDNFMDIRYKCQLITGIDVGRQHIFYYYNDEGPNVPYKITVAGTPIQIDFSYIAKFNPSMEFDMELAKNKDAITVNCFDHVMTIRENAMRINYIFVVDILDVINADMPGVTDMLRDDYQMDLLYYGYIIKYWPQLSINAALLLLSNAPHKELYAKYPLLFPNNGELAKMYNYETKFADMAAHYEVSQKMLSIKSATIIISPKTINTKAALRNIYDEIDISPSILAIILSYEVDPLSIVQLDLSIMSNIHYGTIPITAQKRHIISYQSKYAVEINKFMHEKTPMNSIRIAYVIPGSSYILRFIMFADGKIELTSLWSEYEHIDFIKIQEEITNAGMKIINKIQKMGNLAFINGNIDTFKIEVSKITVINTWEHALTNANYKEILKRLKEYEDAGIIAFRNLQHNNMTIIMFKKGITKGYNPKYDRINGSNNNNSYIRLSDPVVLQRFNTTFCGKMIKFHHRVSDLQVEIVDANSIHEYMLIYSYLFSFLDSLLTGPNKIQIERIVNISQDKKHTTQGSKRLKQLQERDPVLYNLKRYDQSAVVYSVLCQSNRQPFTYTEDEVKYLPQNQKNRAIKYWNFTDNKPLWYVCNNAKYPYLSLRSGVHPLGYCIPCCKTTFLQDKIFTQCMQVIDAIKEKKKPVAVVNESVSNPMSRHVLTWGKDIADGRVSEPPSMVSQLFIGAIKAPFEIKVIGVNQTTPSVPNAGFAMALAHAIAEDDQTPESVLDDLAAYAASMGRTYYALGGVAGLAFRTPEALADCIRAAFVRKEDILTPFSPGGILNDTYPNVLVELVRLAYGYECIVFRESTDGEITVEISAEARINIMTNPNITIFMIVISQAGTYPLSAIEYRFYLRVEYELRWKVERKIFTSAEDSDQDFIRDNVVNIIRGIIRHQKIPPLFDVNTAEQLLHNTKYKIIKRLSNNQNHCYGLLISHPSHPSPFYIPVNNSEYPIDDIPILFGTRPVGSDAPSKIILSVMHHFDIKNYIPVIHDKMQYGIYDIDHKLIWYITPEAYDGNPTTENVMLMPYPTLEIDKAITNYYVNDKTDSDAFTALKKLAAVGRWRNNLYKFYLAEFATIINEERDVSLRKKIIEMISETDFASMNNIQKFRDNIFKLLSGDDIDAMRKIIHIAYKKSMNPVEDIIDMFTSSVFNFDRIILIKLYKMPFDECVAEIKKIMMARCIIDNADQEFNDNMYSGCKHSKSSYCEGTKLKIPQAKFDIYAELLAQAIADNNRRQLLPLLHSGIFNYFKFK